MRLSKPKDVIRPSSQGENKATAGADETTHHTKPVKTEGLELNGVFSSGQHEELESLGKVVGELGDHEPGPVGIEPLAGKVAGTETVLELFDVVLGTAPGEVVFEDARSGAPTIGNDRDVEELAEEPLVALIQGGSLDDQAKGFGPLLRLIGELGPFGRFFPGIGLPALVGNGLDGPAEGGCEEGRDGEVQSLFHEIGDDTAAVETGIEAKAKPAMIGGNTRETLSQETRSSLGAGLIAATKSHADQQPCFGPEAQQRMVSFDGRVGVSSPFFEVAIDLENGAVEVERDGMITAHEAGAPADGRSCHPFELFDVAGGEFSQELTGSGGCGHFEIVEMRAGGLLTAQHPEVAETGAADKEVVHEAHEEVGYGDPSPAFFDGASAKTRKDTEFVGEISEELQAAVRSDLVRGRNVMDFLGASW